MPQRLSKKFRIGRSEKRSEAELQVWVYSALGSELESWGWMRLSREGKLSGDQAFPVRRQKKMKKGDLEEDG